MRHHDPGNLYIKFEVVFPQARPRLNPSELKTLKKITRVESYKGEVQANGESAGEAMVIDEEVPEKEDEEEGEEDPVQRALSKKEERMVKEEPEKAKKEGIVGPRSPPVDVQDPAFPNDPRRRLLVTIEDHYVETSDQSSQPQTNGATMEDDDEDGDGMPSGGERVQCASQ